MSIVVRKATIKDVPQILELWKEFMEESKKTMISKNPMIKQQMIIKKNANSSMLIFIKKNIKSNKAEIYIAEDSGNPIAYCLILIKPNIPIYQPDKFGYISDLFVKKEYRGKGISTRFFKESIKWFRRKKIKYLSIITHSENNKAHDIYKKWKFFDFKIEMRRKI